MLKTKDLADFKDFVESGGWADAFSHATEDLRLEMIEKIEILLDAADAADKVVAEVLFAKNGVASGEGSSTLGEG